MAATTEDTDDILPQLSKEEAIGIMRGGPRRGRTRIGWLILRAALLGWSDVCPTGVRSHENGTAFFLNAGQGVFGGDGLSRGCTVWMRARREGAGPLCLATNGNPLVIDWPTRVIAAHSGIDIATFRVSEREVAELGEDRPDGLSAPLAAEATRAESRDLLCGLSPGGNAADGFSKRLLRTRARFGRRQRRE